jgi:CheY-like chemotaxis protein
MGDQHRILYVEDDESIAEQGIQLLASSGYDCLHAATKVDAIDLVANHDFCCAVVDLSIPHSKGSLGAPVDAGFELIREIRRRYPGQGTACRHHLQIILFSGWADFEDYVQLARRLGCDDFVAKPSDIRQARLDERIERALERSLRVRHESCAELVAKAKPIAERVLEEIAANAWKTFDENERRDVRLGRVPYAKLVKAERATADLGYGLRNLYRLLMQLAINDAGPRGDAT